MIFISYSGMFYLLRYYLLLCKISAARISCWKIEKANYKNE